MAKKKKSTRKRKTKVTKKLHTSKPKRPKQPKKSDSVQKWTEYDRKIEKYNKDLKSWIEKEKNKCNIQCQVKRKLKKSINEEKKLNHAKALNHEKNKQKFVGISFRKPGKKSNNFNEEDIF